jgi:hypothetical protein
MQAVILFVILLFPLTSHSVSIVYNLKIAEATKRHVVEQQFKKPVIAAVTGFDQQRKTYNHTNQNIGGALFTMIYGHKPFYIRADTAVGHASENNKCIPLCDSRTQMDDILIATGLTHVFNERAKATLSGLAGFPTHDDTALQGIELGTGHYGVGVQLDGGYIYSKSLRHSCVAAGRLIQFFSRHADTCITGKPLRFDIGLGNLADLFLSHISNWGTHKLEVGYNATFAFNTTINPPLPISALPTHFTRNSFYASYRYGFLMRTHPGAVTVGLSYGFDSTPKTIGMKYVVTSWLTFGVAF